MPANLLNGKIVAEKIKETLKTNISLQTDIGKPPPELAVILIGNDPASSIYVKNKIKACTDVGVVSHCYALPSETSENTLLKLVSDLNENKSISGILVQLPLPAHIDTTKVIESIHPTKDVDGFHPYNLGRLAQGAPTLRPCTPYGVMQLLKAYDLPTEGKHAVIIGASNIVGRPMALELLHAKATVTICHRATQNLESHIRAADMIIIATGNHDIVKTAWLASHQIVIDIGIHRRDDGTLHGDIDFKNAEKKVAWITPVPGGVGPMTISTLLQNTYHASYPNCN